MNTDILKVDKISKHKTNMTFSFVKNVQGFFFHSRNVMSTSQRNRETTCVQNIGVFLDGIIYKFFTRSSYDRTKNSSLLRI